MNTIKGVSPLIATIVLIAITLVVAGMIATFIQTTATRQLSSVSECTQAKGFIDRGTYDSNAQSLTIYVNNNGRVNLTLNTYVSFFNGSVQTGGQVSVPAGQVIPHTMSGVTNDVKDVSIQSTICAVVDVLASTYISGF